MRILMSLSGGPSQSLMLASFGPARRRKKSAGISVNLSVFLDV
jgi:hypothetical protein